MKKVEAFSMAGSGLGLRCVMHDEQITHFITSTEGVQKYMYLACPRCVANLTDEQFSISKRMKITITEEHPWGIGPIDKNDAKEGK